MLKNTQSKIISIITITQIILITLIGVASYKATNKISVLIFIGVGIVATIIIEMYIYKYLSKYVMYPVNKLIESAEEIKGEEKTNKKENNKNKKSFSKDFKAELKKVVWPTPKQLVNNTVAVIAIVLVTAAIVFVLDLTFETLNKHGVNKIKEVVSANNTVTADNTTSNQTTENTNNETSTEDSQNTENTDNNVEENVQ